MNAARRRPARRSQPLVVVLLASFAVCNIAVQARVAQAGGRGAASSPQPRPQPPSLRGSDTLTKVYDLILDADFEPIDAALKRACGPAPAEACLVLDATALWWRIQLDPDSHELDDDFQASVERAITAAEAWTDRAPESAEAWFYLGGAYAARVQWRVLRDEKLAAARDGKRIKESLERALLLDPQLDDAYFGIGMYRYYAAVAPAAARFLRFLLLLPGGNKEEGLEQMLRARSRGELLQGEADYQLHNVYLWYEQQTERALELLRDLQQQYPGNPLFASQIAEIEDTYEHDLSASLASWRSLLARTLAGRVNEPGLTEARARLAIARHLDTLAQTDEAIDHLERVVALKPAAPYSATALAYLRLGEAHDRLNGRPAATAAYRMASLTVPDGDRHHVRRDAVDRLRKTPNHRHAEAFRLSLAGWRQLERKDVAAAATTLSQSIAMNERDPIARYRFARALIARREPAAARAQLETAIALVEKETRLCPPPILGAIYLEAAQLYERDGEGERAIATYRTASTLFGAGDDTHRLAARAIARLSKR
jgi:tetratricopeptide (TPR) repeat protein